jgi:hypothetical protein
MRNAAQDDFRFFLAAFFFRLGGGVARARFSDSSSGTPILKNSSFGFAINPFSHEYGGRLRGREALNHRLFLGLRGVVRRRTLGVDTLTEGTPPQVDV